MIPGHMLFLTYSEDQIPREMINTMLRSSAKNGAFSFADPPNNAANASSGSTGPECSVLPFDLVSINRKRRRADSGRPRGERHKYRAQ